MAAVRVACSTGISPQQEGLEVSISFESGTPDALFKLVRAEGRVDVQPVGIPPAPLATHLELVRRVLTAFYQARRYYRPPRRTPRGLRSTPSWFNTDPLLLYQVSGLDGASYEVSFEEPDGSRRLAVCRVVGLMQSVDDTLLGTEVQAEKEVYHRLPMRPMNAAVVGLHKLQLASAKIRVPLES
jgi:hypothetical protein